MIDQVTVFIENSEGRLAALCRTMADAGINMTALTIADTADYGLVRIICDDAQKAKEVLDGAEYRAIITKVSAIVVPNRPGGLAELLELLDSMNVNVEYGYCFNSKDDRAVDVLKIHDAGDAVRVSAALTEAGFDVLSQEDLS